MPVTLSTTQPTDGQLRVITISWNMANKEPTQEDVQKILDTYPADTIADLIVVSCQEETRVRKNGLASKLIDSVKFTGTLGEHNRKAHNTFTGGSFGQASLTVLSNLSPTIQFNEYWDPKSSLSNKGGITANISISNCTPVNVANFHLESKKDDRKAVELMELWKKVHHIDRIDKTYSDLTKIAGPTFLMGDGNWRDIAVRHQLDSHTTASPYDDSYYNPARILALCGGTGPNHGISTYSGDNGTAVATPLTGKIDDSRIVGKTNARYMKTGTLDFVSEVGNATCENKVVSTISTPGIDHAPVIAQPTPTSNLSEFERTKKFVVDTIRGLAVMLPTNLKALYETQLSDLKMLSDTRENREALTHAFNFYTKVLSNYAMPSEVARMEGNANVQSALREKVIYFVNQSITLLNTWLFEIRELPSIEILSPGVFDELPARSATPTNTETDKSVHTRESDYEPSVSPPDIATTEAYTSDDEEEDIASPVTVSAEEGDDELEGTVRHTITNDSIRTEPPGKTQLCSSSFFQARKKHKADGSYIGASASPGAAEDQTTEPTPTETLKNDA